MASACTRPQQRMMTTGIVNCMVRERYLPIRLDSQLQPIKIAISQVFIETMEHFDIVASALGRISELGQMLDKVLDWPTTALLIAPSSVWMLSGCPICTKVEAFQAALQHNCLLQVLAPQSARST